MGSFRHGVVGAPPVNRKSRPVRTRSKPKARPKAKSKKPTGKNVLVKNVAVADIEEEPVAVEVVEVEPEAPKPPPEPEQKAEPVEEPKAVEEPVEKVTEEAPKPKKLKDMTYDEKKAFYKERARKARETRMKKKAEATEASLLVPTKFPF
jgi:hypothetical protein